MLFRSILTVAKPGRRHGKNLADRSGLGGAALLWACLALGRAAHGCPADLTLMRDLIGPALPVKPAILVAAFGIGVPASRSSSCHEDQTRACRTTLVSVRHRPSRASLVPAAGAVRVASRLPSLGM